MDGTLIDAKEWHFIALNKALKNFGLNITTHEQQTTYEGLPTSKKLELLTTNKNLSRKCHKQINKLKQEYTIQQIQEKCLPNKCHIHALSKFQQEGYKMAVCSNAVRKTVELRIQKAELTKYFEFLLSNQDVKHPKPHPEIYNLAIKKMGIKPHQAIIIEDNMNGIKSAEASGGHVMKIKGTQDITYNNIKNFINNI